LSDALRSARPYSCLAWKDPCAELPPPVACEPTPNAMLMKPVARARAGQTQAKYCKPCVNRREMDWVAGVDGYKSEWCLVLLHLGSGELRSRIVPSFSLLLDLPERPSVLCVDIPIGLPQFTPRGDRSCEKEARRALGRKATSVFSALGRLCLEGATRLEADHLNRQAGGIGIGAQAWGLSKKLREVDAALDPEAQRTIYEVHPEVSFWAMKGEVPMLHSKKSAEGARERIEALHRGGFPPEFVEKIPNGKVGRDDFLDACAAAWTAKRIANHEEGRFPSEVERDVRGLDMAIWF
jgi:predicted RNase H-like nuclease